MANETDIANRALQMLGAKRIVSLSENSVAARACNSCYEKMRDLELRANVWSFAIKRATLAADAETPDWGRANAFQLPSDFIRLINPYPEDNSLELDYEIEGRKILTDESAPLYIRYLYRVTDPNEFDPLFCEALSARMAMAMCEELTQSNSKKEEANASYKDAVREAKRINSIEKIAGKTPEDEWVTVRY